MKKILIALSLLILSSCGTIGIGKNETVTVMNNSSDPIMVKGRKGVTEIAPNQALAINGNNPLTITPTNKNCRPQIIEQKSNTIAIILDIFPSAFLFGAIPYLIDVATGNTYRMPKNYNYSCQV